MAGSTSNNLLNNIQQRNTLRNSRPVVTDPSSEIIDLNFPPPSPLNSTPQNMNQVKICLNYNDVAFRVNMRKIPERTIISHDGQNTTPYKVS